MTRARDIANVISDANLSGTLDATGIVTANAGLKVDNITIDGTEIDLSSGNLTLDVAGQLIVNSDSGQVVLQDDTVNWGNLQNSSGDFIIGSLGTDKDIKIQGLDGSSTIDALTFDMSNAGQANFNSSIFTGNTAEFVDGTGTGDKGIQLNPIGMVVATRNGGISGIFGRQASSGDILQFRHEGAAVGSIQERFNNIQIGTGETNLLFNNGGNEISPSSSSGGTRDNTTDLGANNRRWRDVYVGSSIRIGGTGTANALDHYEEGTFNCTTSSSGYAIQAQGGRYTRIGRLVHINFVVNFNLVGTSNATVTIAGLPFTVGSFQSAGVIRENSNSGAIYVINVPPSNTEFSFNAMDAVSNNSNRRIHNNENYAGSFTYTI